MHSKQIEDLERLIDKAGLSSVLGAIAGICWAKSEHVASNWQDKGLADLWQVAGDQVDAVQTEGL